LWNQYIIKFVHRGERVMIELLKEYIPRIKSGEFFRENLDALITPEGLKQLFLTAIITGFIFMVCKVFNGDGNGLFKNLWYWFTGFICTGLAHFIFQVLTGLPLKIF